jgi:hypothetical protein
MAHIMEAVPVDLETAELRRLRLNCIKSFAGKNYSLIHVSHTGAL